MVVNSKFVSTQDEIKKYSNMNISPLQKGDIAFVLSGVPNGKAISRAFYVYRNNMYTLNQRIAAFTTKADIDSKFLYYVVNRNPYFLRFDDGVGQTNLSKSDVLNFEGYYPTYREQPNISLLLWRIDMSIATNQRKLEKLQELKKGYLQKMFC
nr:restriction endonuclease subunit S [Loigolactobacillus bifermentans]